MGLTLITVLVGVALLGLSILTWGWSDGNARFSAFQWDGPHPLYRRWIAGVVGVAMAIGALLAIGYRVYEYFHDKDIASSSASTTSDPIDRIASPRKTSGFNFEAPIDGSRVHGSFTVKGHAPPLGGDKLWLFDYAGNANVGHEVYYRTSESPIEVKDGAWSTTDGPLGRLHDDIGAHFKIVLVIAAPQCSATLKSTEANAAGDVIFRELPSGCWSVGSVTVIKAAG